LNKSAEEVMLEHLSYRYNQPERFSSLGLPHEESSTTVRR
jgi:hypothetical protein